MKTSHADKILDSRGKGNEELSRLMEEEALNVHVARIIYDARTAANLTQSELAEMIGTKQSVISRLEDADYDGHSLRVLDKIARALNRRLLVEMEPLNAVAG